MKHIKAKYFLIKDYYDSGEIELRYCLTYVMWADILTKPLQGQKIRDMRVFLQNCPRDYDDDIKLKTDHLAWRSMNQQVKTVASWRECVDGHNQPSNQANHNGIHEHEPQEPHVCHESHGAHHTSHGSHQSQNKGSHTVSAGSHKESHKELTKAWRQSAAM